MMDQKDKDNLNRHIELETARVRDAVKTEQLKRNTIKETLDAFHAAINQRENTLKENIARTHSEGMSQLTEQATKLEEALSAGDTGELENLLKKMAGNQL